jgi:hypothetical protein
MGPDQEANDEVERRGVAPTSNEADLSRSSTASFVHRRYSPRSLEPIARPPPASHRVSSTSQQQWTPQCDWRKEYSSKITHGNASVITRDRLINAANIGRKIEHGEAVDEKRKAECHNKWPRGHAEAVRGQCEHNRKKRGLGWFHITEYPRPRDETRNPNPRRQG